MTKAQMPVSVEDAVSGVPPEDADDLHAWQASKLAERRKRADEGHFASVEAVRSVIRKFIPNG